MVPAAEKNSSIRFMGMNTTDSDRHLKDPMRYKQDLVQRGCRTSLGPGCLAPLAAQDPISEPEMSKLKECATSSVWFYVSIRP